MRKRLLAVAALTFMGSVVATSQAALIAGWNSNADGWEWESGSTSTNGSAINIFDTSRFTEGNASLRATANASGYRLLIKSFGSLVVNGAINAGNATDPVIVSIDVFLPVGSFNEVQFGYLEAVVVRTSFVTSGNLNLAAITPGSWTTITTTLSAGDVNADSLQNGFWGLQFGVNTNWTVGTGPDAAVMLFDNLQISPVPEPATLAVTVVAGAMILLRRRA